MEMASVGLYAVHRVKATLEALAKVLQSVFSVMQYLIELQMSPKERGELRMGAHVAHPPAGSDKHPCARAV